MLIIRRKHSFDPVSYVSRVKEYIRLKQEEERKQSEAVSEMHAAGVQFSFADTYDGEEETLLQQIRNAKTPEAAEVLTQKYLDWEKEKAVRSSFSKRVLDWLERRRMRPSEFYRAAGIEKRTFSKMKNDYLYQPSRDTALRSCFGLRLSWPDALALLRLAGFTFNPSDSRDLALRYCLEHELYDIEGVNALMQLLGEDPF